MALKVFEIGKYWAIGTHGHYTVYRKESDEPGAESVCVAEFFSRKHKEQLETCIAIKHLVEPYKDRLFAAGGVDVVRKFMAEA